MLKKSLSLKILGIIGLTLFIGFAVLGLTTLWLSTRSNLKLSMRSAHDSAAIIRKTVDDYMIRDDNAGFARYVTELRGNGGVLDLKIYNSEGKQRSAGSLPEPRVLEAFRSGRETTVETRDTNNTPILTLIMPLQNQGRCKECHAETGPIGAIMLTTSLAQGYKEAGSQMIVLCALGGSCFLLIIGGMYLFFRLTIISNILEMSNTVRMLAEGEGDLTVVVPLRSEDEIGRLGADINKLVTKLREIISTLYDQAGHIALSTCRTMGGIESLGANIMEQRELAASVAVASEEMSVTLNDVALTTIRASDLSRQVDDSARNGERVVADTAASMDQIKSGVETTIKVMARLENSSGRIGAIIGMIGDVADQTNLLALNAAIEAARAGDAGRGFAVVANEVKVLSAKTSASTREISDIIKSIQTDIREATDSIEEEKERVETGIVNSGRASSQIAAILDIASQSADMINSIAGATEEQSATTAEISAKIHQVSETAMQTQTHMEEVAVTFNDISMAAEHIYSTVGRFNVDNYHCVIKKLLMELRDRTTATLEQALATRRITMEALFSTDYTPISNTWPQKYATPFDKLFDELISPLQEEIIGRDSGIFFAICADSASGYVPSHNLRYSKPLTGDRTTDMRDNRTKRKFNDRSGLRIAANTEPILLQTYYRDTGEIMNDISTPLFIGGKHWGAVRIGYRADA